VPFSISGSTAGWIGADSLPHVAALPHVAEQPWYLGNGTAPTTLLADGTTTWNADLTTSQPLTNCSITITTATTTVATLPCDTTQTPLGEADASWNGKNTQGKLAAAGTYTWTLTGTGTDGPLLNSDGTPTAITGTITVTAPTTTTGTGTGTGDHHGTWHPHHPAHHPHYRHVRHHHAR
jgi:hypothetical protein